MPRRKVESDENPGSSPCREQGGFSGQRVGTTPTKHSKHPISRLLRPFLREIRSLRFKYLDPFSRFTVRDETVILHFVLDLNTQCTRIISAEKQKTFVWSAFGYNKKKTSIKSHPRNVGESGGKNTHTYI